MLAWGFGVLLAMVLAPKIATYSCNQYVYFCGAHFEAGDISFFLLILGAALLGLLDDIFALKPVLKFSGQGALALLFIFLIGHIGFVPIPLFENWKLGVFGVPLTFFWIVGLMNVYNFMDGADGLAASVAVLVLTVIALVAFFDQHATIIIFALLMVAALLAFLPFNMCKSGLFSKGLFMGDSGSQMISFLIAGFAIMLPSGTYDQTLVLFVPVLMLPLITDVAFTLVHRGHRRQNLLQAHREHVYQLMIRMGASHKDVSMIYVGLTGICAVAGFFMLSMANWLQWTIPLILFFGMWLMALMVFKRAKFKGIIAGITP